MAQSLRKIFQKNLLSGADTAPRGWRERAGLGDATSRGDGAGRGRPAENTRRQPREAGGGGARRRTLDLSGAAALALGLALVAGVGWSFFMGYLVGRGEHPERGVESVAGLLRPKGATDAVAPPHQPLPGEEALLPPPEGAAASGAPATAGAAPENTVPDSAPGAAAGVRQESPSAPPAETGAAPAQPAPPAAPAYPFSRPQGEGLAAWGIVDGARAVPRPQQAAGPAAAAQTPAAVQARPAPTPPKPAEPRFDYVFQAAAFKGPVDAERLRARLEGAGLRTRVRQSGKVRLVLVSVRGSARDADKVRGQLAAMGLGRPVQLEKKPVTETTGGKGRRRSAP